MGMPRRSGVAGLYITMSGGDAMVDISRYGHQYGPFLGCEDSGVYRQGAGQVRICWIGEISGTIVGLFQA